MCTNLRAKTFQSPNHGSGGLLLFCEFSLHKFHQVLPVKIREKFPSVSGKRREKERNLKELWNKLEHSVLLSKVCPQEKLFKETNLLGVFQSLTLEEGKYPTQAPCSHPVPPKSWGDWEVLVKFTVQGHRLTKSLRPNHRTTEQFPSPTPHCHVTKGLLTGVPFPQYIMPGYQEKVTRHTKRQKKTYFEETEQTSETDSDIVVGIIRLGNLKQLWLIY